MIDPAIVTDTLQLHSEYDTFLARLQERFSSRLRAEGNLLFTTDAENLFDTYLEHLPPHLRQRHTCYACRRFVETYGALVLIQASGESRSALWDATDAPDELRTGIAALEAAVERAKVTGVSYCAEPVWGKPVTGPWTHLAVTPPPESLFERTTQTALQAMAQKGEDYRMVLSALAEFPLAAIDQALRLLKTDSLYQAEKVVGVARWLKALHEMRAQSLNRVLRENLTWRAVATAPAGYCHVRSTMIGSLLEDIVAGHPFDAIAARFARKMDPTRYQRPQAAPDAGNIARAERVLEQLGAARSLERRFARLEEVQALWQPRPAPIDEAPKEGIFSHLKPTKDAAIRAVQIPKITFTWEKFQREVLPEADAIEYFTADRGNYCALVTAVHADAPAILQWDHAQQRNPVSWYVYPRGSRAEQWGLPTAAFHRVNAVTHQPSAWYGDYPHHGNSVIFLLDGARDQRASGAGLALFPSFLKSEFHEIRSTIEAYSRSKEILGVEQASACGIRLCKGAAWNEVFRVTSKGGQIDYRLDRWD